MEGKLTIHIQSPGLGKGWYKDWIDLKIAASDEEIIQAVLQKYGCFKVPEDKVTGIRITREYQLT